MKAEQKKSQFYLYYTKYCYCARVYTTIKIIYVHKIEIKIINVLVSPYLRNIREI